MFYIIDSTTNKPILNEDGTMKKFTGKETADLTKNNTELFQVMDVKMSANGLQIYVVFS